MKTLRYILILLVALLALESCVKDNTDNCPNGIYLSFESINPKYNFTDIVEKLDLFIYDRYGDLANELNYTREELRAAGYMAYVPEMPTGKYTVVALVNADEKDYEISGTERLMSMYVALIAQNNQVSEQPADLYQSYREISFGIDTKVDEDQDDYKMMLTKNTNHINLTLQLESALPSNTELDVQLVGNNTMYNFQYQSVDTRNTTYVAHTNSYAPTIQEYGFTTMRLWIGDNLTINIGVSKDGAPAVVNQTLWVTDVLSKITDQNGEKIYDTNDKLELEDNFYITAMLDADYNIVGLIINDWTVIKPGIDF